MNQGILKLCIEKGLLVDKEALELLSGFEDNIAQEIVEQIALSREKIINKSFFNKNFERFKNSGNFYEKLCVKLGVSIEISREVSAKPAEAVKTTNSSASPMPAHLGNIKVIYSGANLAKKIEVQDFVKYFRNRFSLIRNILQQRPDLDGLVSINKIGNSTQRQSISVVGIVMGKRITKNKNILLDIEDTTGRISVLINQNKPEVYDKAKDIITDIVIGVKGTGNREFIFANDIIYPDLTLQEKFSYDKDESVAFTSDIHVGSKMFLEKNFLKFIDWLNGNLGDEKQRAEARKVKYLFITGDTIDGIGIYPGQEAWLTIKDIKKQYEKLAEYLSKLRKDLTIILCPGQHDAVRVAEPQPAIGKGYGYALHELENVILVSNPAIVEISNGKKKGVKVLMYHGDSLIPVYAEVDSLRVVKARHTPAKIVRYLLKIRHLSPIHSASIYIPDEKEDCLVIKDVPNIILTADLHRPEVDMYNNVLIVCSSCWQSMTPFEEKVGNHPDPCKVPILDLKTRQIKIMDFSETEKEKEIECKEEKDKIICGVNAEGEKKI